MVKLTVSDVIHRPVEAVFAFATDPLKSQLWQTENVVAEKSLAADPQGKARVVKTVKGLGFKTDFTMETVEFEPNRKIVTNITGGGRYGHVSGRGKWLFDGVPEGTRVTFDWEVELGGLLKLAAPVFAPLARRTLRCDLLNLKKVMEA
jgi:carbon monoxide dehydrogenase subunit G